MTEGPCERTPQQKALRSMRRAGNPGAEGRGRIRGTESKGQGREEQSMGGSDVLTFALGLEGNKGTTEQRLLISRHWSSGARHWV